MLLPDLCVHHLFAALDDIVQPIKSVVRSSVNPVKAVRYTSAAFLTVARAVLAADENQVPTAEILMLLKALDTATNENATLRALVQCNVVTVRPVSEWAFDIPRSSFGDWEELVMAPSAVHLCAWKMVLPPLIQLRLINHRKKSRAFCVTSLGDESGVAAVVRMVALGSA
jgi:hypothetical protein